MTAMSRRFAALCMSTLLVASCGAPTETESVVASSSIRATDLCITDTGTFGSGGVLSLTTAIQCKTQQQLVSIFDGMSVVLGLVAACGVAAPEPFITKGAAAAMAVGASTSSAISFLLRQADCEGGNLSEADERQVKKLICQQMGKTWRAGGAPNGDDLCH